MHFIPTPLLKQLKMLGREERKSKRVNCEDTSNSGTQLVWSSGTHSKNALLECCGVCCAAFGLFSLEVGPTDFRRLN